MADNKKSVNLLPEYLKTDKNSKFLSGTLDPLIQSPQLERIDGFVGSKITPNYDPTKDFYLKEDLAIRKDYSNSVSMRKLANKYAVRVSTIHQILLNKTWKNIMEEVAEPVNVPF